MKYPHYRAKFTRFHLHLGSGTPPRVWSCLVAIFIGLLPALGFAGSPPDRVPALPVTSRTKQEIKKPLANFTVNPLIRFKNSKFQVLAGKKEPNSAIYVNDQEVIPQNPQKETVVLQDFGLVDTFQSHDDCIEQRQDQLGRMINLILLGKTNRLLQELFEPKLLAKTVNQKHPTVMRQMAPPEENFDFAVSFWHNTQTSLLVHFLCDEFDKQYYIPFSSENTNLKSKNKQISRIFEVYFAA